MKHRAFALLVLLFALSAGARAATTCAATTVSHVSWLCIDPVATNHLYIEADNKLLRSTDSGATWTDTPVLSNIARIAGVIGIAIDPNTSGVVYATSSGGGISKSTDFGSTWTSFKFSFSSTLGGIFVDPANSQRLYVARRFGQGCLNVPAYSSTAACLP